MRLENDPVSWRTPEKYLLIGGGKGHMLSEFKLLSSSSWEDLFSLEETEEELHED